MVSVDSEIYLRKFGPLTRGYTDASSSGTSELNLQEKLREVGRDVSHLMLVRWRRLGLLPPIAQRGPGAGKGTSSFWIQADIVSHATYVFDLIQTKTPRHDILRSLWLSGFDVPITRLRRAWLHSAKRDQSWHVKPTDVLRRKHQPQSLVSDQNISIGNSDYRGARALLNLLISVSGVLSPVRPASTPNKFHEVINLVLLTLSPKEADSPNVGAELRERVVMLAETLGLAIEKSNLLEASSEAELHSARRHLSKIGQLVRVCTKSDNSAFGKAPFWPLDCVEDVAATLFLYILVLIRMGYSEQLNSTSEALDRFQTHWMSKAGNWEGAQFAEDLEITKFRHRCASVWKGLVVV